ncbi:hypothetical protein IJI86_00785 [Candidatus Saccharibacteria bacterium]|nr:hypothetical protein [Candidatus Saccharibacteria bacterium]
MERDTAVNQDQAELSFAAKIDYLQPAGAYNTTLQFNIVANPLVNYMQDLNPALCTTTPMTVVDKRDSQEYIVQRLADGNCWMITNLNLGAVELATDLTSNNTNLSTPISASSFNSWKNGSGSGAERYVVVSGIDSVSQTPNGVLYNFCAASGSTRCGSTTAKATDDICPAGWRLPTSVGTSSEYTRLYNQYGSYANMTKPIANGGAAFARPGYSPSGTSISNSGTYGFYWSSENRAATTAWGGLFLNPSGTVSPDNWIDRSCGTSVRCILNDSRTISDITTMQEMSPQIAAKMNDGDTATLKDSRDGQDYTIAKINGNVWMTRNLAIGCNGTGSTYGSTITSKTLTSSDTNISAATWSTPTNNLTLGNSTDDPRIECSSTYGAWYNFRAASAGAIGDNTTASVSDICPSGWRLASQTEINQVTSYGSSFIQNGGNGYYRGGALINDGAYWWASTLSTSYRGVLYNPSGTSLRYGSAQSYDGCQIRCIAK